MVRPYVGARSSLFKCVLKPGRPTNIVLLVIVSVWVWVHTYLPDSTLFAVPWQMGFLYLRFLLNPRTIWDWIEGYLGDREVGCHSSTPDCIPFSVQHLTHTKVVL